MPATAEPASSGQNLPCLPALLAVVIICAFTLAAYHNSFNGPFVFDDRPTIVENPTIRQLWPLSQVLSPPTDRGLTTNGRPLVNLSLAINYAIGGVTPRGYHVFNVTLHLFIALVLFGVVRRTLAQPQCASGNFAVHADWLALVIATLWSVHPLQTAAVTYIVQRAEVLMGLFYLLALYAFIRAEKSPRTLWWQTASVAVCFAGMATKEVMATAPLVIFLYDRTFIAGSFREAWRQRWKSHLALASSWLFLSWLMLHNGGRGGTAGFGLATPWWQYGLTQISAVIHYLRLTLWPHPLVFDYGGAVLVKNFSDVWPQALLLTGLLGVTAWSLWQRPVIGFALTWCFVILAPTSSVVPIADTIFEHRMYLPLAGLLALLVCAIHRMFGRGSLLIGLAGAVALGFTTVHRNEIYRNEVSLWTDTAAKRPQSVRAHYTLGSVLAEQGRAEEALAEYQTALTLKADSFETHNNLGNLLTRLGHADDAREHYEAALALRPNSADAHNNLGNALLRQGLTFKAMEQYTLALQFDPHFADAHNNLANLHMRLGEKPEAITHYEAALQARPDFADAHGNLANALAESNRMAEAIPHYEAALRLRPDSANLHYNFALTLEHMGNVADAVNHYQETLRLAPDHQGARNNLARLH